LIVLHSDLKFSNTLNLQKILDLAEQIAFWLGATHEEI